MNGPRPYPGDLAPDRADARFWQACREHRFLLFRCKLCGRAVWPAGSCPRHGMAAMVWCEASGLGRLHSWTVVHQRYETSFADPPPNVAVVELDEGALMHATVLGADRLRAGMRLRVDFDDIGDAGAEVVVPVFRPEPEGEGAT